MATRSTFYLNAPSLGSATAAFSNNDLTICAPDGFYSDGTIVRQQVGCVLLPQQTCGTCSVPCGFPIDADGEQGVYLVNLNTGTDIGAVIIRFNPYDAPDGIRVVFNGVTYNKLTSPVNGLHQSSNAGHYTFVGNTGSDCGISGTTYPALQEFLYNGTIFAPTSTTQSVTVAPGDVSMNPVSPGNCMIVIPKTTPTPSIINLQMVGPCLGTGWRISTACPVLLTGFSSSSVLATSELTCDAIKNRTYYNASLDNTPGIVDVYDFVYSDNLGANQLPNGFYNAEGSIAGGADWFQVSNGIVIAVGSCTVPLPVTGLIWDTTVNNPCDATPWVISNQNLKIRYNITNSLNCGGTCDSLQAGTATATITVGGVDVNMGLSFNGIGELKDPDFEKIVFKLDNVQIADAHAAGGNLGCAMGPVVQTFVTPPPYLLLANSVHTLFIDFTTNDERFHVGSFYEVDLTFTEII